MGITLSHVRRAPVLCNECEGSSADSSKIQILQHLLLLLIRNRAN